MKSLKTRRTRGGAVSAHCPLPTAHSGAPCITLDPWKVKPFADQPRKRFFGIARLAQSIRLVGQVTPAVVTPCRDSQNGFTHELVDGERRLQACRHGKLPLKAVVEKEMPADRRFALSIAANFCREPHDAVEIAQAVQRLYDDGRTDVEVGAIFGKSGCWVHQHRSLLKLHPDVLGMLKRAEQKRNQGKSKRRNRSTITFSTALLLLRLDHSRQIKAAKQIVAKEMSMAAARAYLMGIAKKDPKSVSKDVRHREISPKAKFHTLWNVLDTFRHRIEPLVELSGDRLAAVFQAANLRERRAMQEHIEEIVFNLQALASTLKAIP